MADIEKDQFQNNSHKQKEKEEASPPKKATQIATGKVVQKKKPIGERLLAVFCETNKQDVGNYILYDVVIPTTKNTLSELGHGLVDIVTGGESKGHRTHRTKGKSYVSYNAYYTSEKKKSERGVRRSKDKARMNFNDILLESRGEAEQVLSTLVDMIDEYESATVADFYDLVGIEQSYTDRAYGWEALGNAYITRERDGYLIHLPNPTILD